MNVLMLIKTSGLEYDDRLRKEALSLSALGVKVRIVALEDANIVSERNTYSGVLSKTVKLQTRRIFSQTKGLTLKVVELYLKFIIEIVRDRPDIVWFHDIELAGLVPFLSIFRKTNVVKRLIWDQHELPSNRYLFNPLAWRLFAFMCNNCDSLIAANFERRNLLKRHDRRIKTPIFVLQNFPDNNFAKLPRQCLPDNLQHWLKGESYLLAQGGAAPNRYFEELVSAIIGLPSIKLVVVGPSGAEQVKRLLKKHGESFNDRILLVGYIPQLEIAPFIDNSLASIVLYGAKNENHRLCAPNRLYQAIIRGIPVVVGANPPMADFVHDKQCGVVLLKDGRDIRDIQSGISTLVRNHDKLRNNALKYGAQVNWESQTTEIIKLVDITKGHN